MASERNVMSSIREPLASMAALGLAALCAACSTSSDTTITSSSATVDGSGVLVEEMRPIGSFTGLLHQTEGMVHVAEAGAAALAFHFSGVVASSDGSLRIDEVSVAVEQTAEPTLLVRAEDNLLAHLQTVVEGDVLALRTEEGVDLEPTLPIEFFVTVPSLVSITLQGVGSIDVTDLTADEISVTCAGVGDVDLVNLEAPALDVLVQGIGGVSVSGRVDRQTVDLRGIGSYQAADLESREAEVVVNGIGSATVRVTELLRATVNGAGSIFFRGDPTTDARGAAA